MVQINWAKREVQCKVVYYGPAESGKTANLRSIHERSPERVRGALTTIATDTQRTLFFDFLSLNLGEVAGMVTKIHLYAVPYIDHQNAVRTLILEGVDGVVFVASSERSQMAANREALANLRENLARLGRKLTDVPHVFQWNKADVAEAVSPEEIVGELGLSDEFSSPAVATTGEGIFTTLKTLTQKVLENASRILALRQDPEPVEASVAEPEPAPAPQPEPAFEEMPLPSREEPLPLPQPHFEEVALPAEPGRPEPEPLPPLPPLEEVEEQRPLPSVPSWRRSEPDERLPAAAVAPAAPEPDEPAFPSDPETADMPEPPPAVVEAAEALPEIPAVQEAPAARGGWKPPAREAGFEAPEKSPARPRGARFAGPTKHTPRAAPQPYRGRSGWDAADPEDRYASTRQRRDAQPVVERRRRPRIADMSRVAPVSSFVAGAACALISLITIGYLVYALL